MADVLAEHVVFEVESTDPMQLNTYVTGLQCADGQVAHVHH